MVSPGGGVAGAWCPVTGDRLGRQAASEEADEEDGEAGHRVSLRCGGLEVEGADGSGFVSLYLRLNVLAAD